MTKPAAKVWRRALENTERFLMWPWLSRVNCPTWHSMDIVDPALHGAEGLRLWLLFVGLGAKEKHCFRE